MPASSVARRVLLAAAVVGSAMVLLVSASGYALLAWSDSSIERVDAFAGLDHRPRSGSGTTFLLVGSDNRDGMSRADWKRLRVGNAAKLTGRRADTMLLVHVSDDRPAMTAVSLPRDSYVTIPEHEGADGTRVRTHRSKLNAAYALGGPPLAVATVERSTGVRVDHYVEVDFLGFEHLVDSVGGVDVCSPTPLRDRKAGLRLPKGVTHVNGATGLAYVRARNLDARADLGRIERQQRFLGAMAHRVTSREVLLDPRTLVRFLDAALGAVRTDEGLQRRELVELGSRLRHVPDSRVRFLTVPVSNPSYRPGGVGAVALWDEDAAGRLFAGLRDGNPPAPAGAAQAKAKGAVAPTVPPSQVRVQVYNGAGVAGLGTKVTSELVDRGFDSAGPARNWRTSDVERTVLRYDARYTESIKTLAAAVPKARLEKVTGLGRTLQVVVGSSYAGARKITMSSPTVDAPRADGRTADDDPCR